MNSTIIKHLLIYLLVVTGIVLLLEQRYSSYYTIPDNLYYKMDERAPSFTHIYIGNSHTGGFHAYHPDSSAKICNLSMQGQDLFKEYAVLKKWLPKMVNVHDVLLGLDYEVLGQNQALNGEEYLDRQFYRYTDTMYRYSFSNVIMARSSFFRANRDIKFLFSNGENAGDPSKMELNFIPVDSRKRLSDIECKKRATENSVIKFQRKSISENLSYLSNIIDLCGDQKVKLHIVNTPKSECYLGYVNKENTMLAKQKIDSLIATKGMKYYDYVGSSLFNQGEFADYDHINYTASKKLIDLIYK